jgi:hypothetical protein
MGFSPSLRAFECKARSAFIGVDLRLEIDCLRHANLTSKAQGKDRHSIKGYPDDVLAESARLFARHQWAEGTPQPIPPSHRKTRNNR